MLIRSSFYLCLCVPLKPAARQRFGKHVAAAANIHATKLIPSGVFSAVRVLLNTQFVVKKVCGQLFRELVSMEILNYTSDL
jgi:hypothetical protein